jgi:hypothetical protein
MITIFNVGDLVWKTKDGQQIAYRDLDESHIRNIAKKKFYRIRSYSSITDNMDNNYEEEEVSYAKLMELELLRRTICKILNIEL